MKLFSQIPEDKQGHITLGLLIGLAFANYPSIAVTILLAIAFGKEFYDWSYNKATNTETHGVELLDLVATLFGGALGLSIVFIINSLISIII